MGMILRIASSRIVGQGDIVGRSGYFSLNLSANSVMRGRLDARRTLKSLVADLREKKTGKRGHPKWFDGRIDFANLDLTRCKEYEVNKGKLYGLRVYAKALKRYVSLAIWYPMDGRTDKWQLYFSTDDSMDGREVLDYYRTRFQLEFCFRDGKQHAGITNCQSTDFRKLDFHFNASLAAVNLAKAAC